MAQKTNKIQTEKAFQNGCKKFAFRVLHQHLQGRKNKPVRIPAFCGSGSTMLPIIQARFGHMYDDIRVEVCGDQAVVTPTYPANGGFIYDERHPQKAKIAKTRKCRRVKLDWLSQEEPGCDVDNELRSDFNAQFEKGEFSDPFFAQFMNQSAQEPHYASADAYLAAD